MNTIVLCAIPEEVEGLHYTDVFFTGVGKINAASTTEQVIRDYKPKLIINYGTAGSLDPDIKGLIKVLLNFLESSRFFSRNSLYSFSREFI